MTVLPFSFGLEVFGRLQLPVLRAEIFCASFMATFSPIFESSDDYLVAFYLMYLSLAHLH